MSIRRLLPAVIGVVLLAALFFSPDAASATTPAPNGLNAKIYDVSGQSIPPVLTESATAVEEYTVPVLSENFDSNPRAGLQDTFIVKYTGYIVLDTTTAVSFYGPADDGFRLIVDSVTVINDWYDKGGGGSVSDPVSFTANVPKRIEAWFYENGGGANVELQWDASGQMALVPTGNLYLTDPQITVLDQCVSNINDANFTKAAILSIIGMNEQQLLAAVEQGTITIVIAQGSGEFGNGNGNARDIYCGNSQNNTVSYLDSNYGTRDYFFGGAGNDYVGHSWFSNFYGGAGDDTIDYLDERSFFYGGAGEDSCTHVSQGNWGSTCNPENTIAPSLNPPTNLIVSAQSDGMHLSWTAPVPTEANTAVEIYAVSWSTSNFTTNGWGISSSQTSIVIDYSVINSTDGRGKEYQFNIRSDNNTLLVFSSNSGSVTAYVPREAPTISLTPKNLSIDVSVSYTNPNTWFYQVLTVQDGCANPYTGQTLNTDGHPETFTVSNLDNNCLYQIKVANWDSATSLYASESSTPVAPTPTPTPTPTQEPSPTPSPEPTPQSPPTPDPQPVTPAPTQPPPSDPSPPQPPVIPPAPVTPATEPDDITPVVEVPDETVPPTDTDPMSPIDQETIPVDPLPEDPLPVLPDESDTTAPELQEPDDVIVPDDISTDPIPVVDDSTSVPPVVIDDNPIPSEKEIQGDIDSALDDGKVSIAEIENIAESMAADGEIDAQDTENIIDALSSDGTLSNADKEAVLDALGADGDISKEDVAAVVALLAGDGVLTNTEKAIVADALVQQFSGEKGVDVNAIAEAGIDLADLPPETPIELNNGVVIVAEIANAFETLSNPDELLSAVFTDPGQVLMALTNIGADMSDEERAASEKTVIASVIATGAAVNAAAGAAAAAASASGSSSSSSGSNSGGTSRSGDGGAPIGKEGSSRPKRTNRLRRPSK